MKINSHLVLTETVRVKIEVCDRIERVDAREWNALCRDSNPFLRHEFLSALERQRCVGHHFGWRPRHLLIHQAGRLVAATPLYLKDNSYGEFVFDFTWADAYQQQGLSYYPKLVSAIPFTPATGERILVAPGVSTDELYKFIIKHATALAESSDASSLHILFVNQQENSLLQSMGLVTRLGVQFHWQNRGYKDFDAFLSALNAKRRKNIRRERRLVQACGLNIRVLHGNEATAQEWQQFSEFYTKTFEERYSLPTLNFGFFQEIGRTMGDQIILVLAYDASECVAGALMFKSQHTLYGRHWGCNQHYDNLHFEVCYYQGIEYCIKKGLKQFEPGAQGEHKIWRGFLPTLTYSNHWIRNPRLREAITRFLRRESPAVIDYKTALKQSSPYRQEK